MDVNMSTAVYGLLFLLFSVESVVFELNDYDLNRIVYEFETNIKMTCDASEVVNQQIVINYGNINVELIDNNYVSNRSINTLELTITRVNLSHGGAYECVVTSEQGLTEVSELLLNVTNGGRFCLQNETSLVKMEGGYFTLYCYFLWFLPVQNGSNVTAFDNTWNVTDGVTLSSLTGPTDVTEGNVKGAIVFNVGPLALSDNGSKYICSHPQPGSRPCNIGPITVQARSIANPTTVPNKSAPTTITVKRTSFITSTDNVTIRTATKSTEQPTPSNSGLPYSSTEENGTPSTIPSSQRTLSLRITEPSNVPSDFLLILIVSVPATIAVGVFLTVMICLALGCCKCSEKRESKNPTARLDYELTDNPVYGSGDDDDTSPTTQSGPSDCGSGDARATSSQASVNQRDKSSLASTSGHHFGRESSLDGRKYDVPMQGPKVVQGRVPAPHGAGGDDRHSYDNASGGVHTTGKHTNDTITNREETAKSGTYDDPPPSTVGPRDEVSFVVYDNNVDIPQTECAPRGSDEEKAEGDFDYLYGVVKKVRKKNPTDIDGESAAMY